MVGGVRVSLILQAKSAGTFMFLVGPLKSDRLYARDHTKINYFSFELGVYF